MASEVSVDGRVFRALLRTHGSELAEAILVGPDVEVPLTCGRRGW